MFNSRYQKDFPEKNVHESSAAVLDFVLDFVLVTPSTPHVLLSIKHDPYPPEWYLRLFGGVKIQWIYIPEKIGSCPFDVSRTVK